MSVMQKEKNAGDGHFRAGKFLDAIHHYELAINAPQPDKGVDTLDCELKVRLNRAAALLKLQRFSECLDDCDVVLEVDSTKHKARFRRLQPQALLGLHRFDEAMHEAAFLTRDTPGDASVLELTRSAIEQARRTSEQTSISSLIAKVETEATAGSSGTAGEPVPLSSEPNTDVKDLHLLSQRLKMQPDTCGEEFAAADGAIRLLLTAPAAPLPIGTFATQQARGGKEARAHTAHPTRGRFKRPLVSIHCIGVLSDALHSGPAGAAHVVQAMASPTGAAVWEARPKLQGTESGSGPSESQRGNASGILSLGGSSTTPAIAVESAQDATGWELPPGCSWAARDHEVGRVTFLSEVAQQAQVRLLQDRQVLLRSASVAQSRGTTSSLDDIADGAKRPSLAISLDDVRIVIRRAFAAIDEILSRSVGVMPNLNSATMSTGGAASTPSTVLNSTFVAALRAVGRMVCTRMGADTCIQHGILRIVVRHAADGVSDEVQAAARSALARVVDRRSRNLELPDEYMQLLLARTRAEVARAVQTLSAAGVSSRSKPLPDSTQVESVRGRRMLERHDPNASIAAVDLVMAVEPFVKSISIVLKSAQSKGIEHSVENSLTADITPKDQSTVGAGLTVDSSKAAPKTADESLSKYKQDKARIASLLEEETKSASEQAWRSVFSRGYEGQRGDCARAAAVVCAVFLVDRQAALLMLEKPGVLPAALSLAYSFNDSQKELAADIIGFMCADEAGRALMSAEVFEVLGTLAKSSHSSVRAAAAVSIAKTLVTATANRDGAGANVNLSAPLTEGDAVIAEEADRPSAATGNQQSEQAATERSQAVLELYAGVADALSMSLDGLSAPSAEKSRLEAPGAFDREHVSLRTASRSIEALACISNKVPIKQRLVQDAETLRVVLELARRAAEKQSIALATYYDHQGQARGGASALEQEWGPIALGACYVLLSIVRSEDEERLKALADKEITVKQWEDFQRLTLSQQSAGPEPDPAPQVDERVRLLLGSSLKPPSELTHIPGKPGAASDGYHIVPMLAQLCAAARGIHALAIERSGRGSQGGSIQAVQDSGPLNPLFGRARSQWQPLSETEEALRKQQEERNRGPGAGVLEAVSSILVRIAARGQWSRSDLLQSGALPLLNALAFEASGNSVTGRTAASRCIALLLMSCNPTLLPENQVMDAVPPLLLVCRGRDAMHQFESAVALTNITSMGEDAVERVVSANGVPALLSLVFEHHCLLRRSGVETLCNMAFHPAVIQAIAKDYLRLWLGMSKAFGEVDAGKVQGARMPSSGAGEAAVTLEAEDQDHVSEWDGTDFKTAEAASGALATAASCDDEAAASLLHGGGVAAMAELMASGAPSLQLRAIACLESMTSVPEGWKILSEPILLGNSGDATEADSMDVSGKGDRAAANDLSRANAAALKLVPAAVSVAAIRGTEATSMGDEGWRFAPLRLIAAIAGGTAMRDITQPNEQSPKVPAEHVRNAAVELLQGARTTSDAKLVEDACTGLAESVLVTQRLGV